MLGFNLCYCPPKGGRQSGLVVAFPTPSHQLGVAERETGPECLSHLLAHVELLLPRSQLRGTLKI